MSEEMSEETRGVMTEEMSEQIREGRFEDDLFNYTMKEEWKQVVEIYKKHPIAHKTKLTRSEETAFHIAISSYHSKSPFHAIHIEQMFDIMERDGSLIDVLSMQNVRGDTPLHLAAAVGIAYICEIIAERKRELIGIRNGNGETPLFVAAYHGKLQAFLCLHELYNSLQDEPADSLCRRKDGNTILHSAISGEFFTYQIISYYPKLVYCINVDGESPLHVLARKPNVFKSGNHLPYYDSIIYHSVFVDELKIERYEPRANQHLYYSRRQVKYPENCTTFVGICSLIWTPIYKIFSAVFSCCKKQNGGLYDEENHQPREKKPEIYSAETKSANNGSFPPNYTTCILLCKVSSKLIPIILAGFRSIKKIQAKKIRHCHALEIMNKLIEYESMYNYGSDGQRPFVFLRPGATEIPGTPLEYADEPDADQITRAYIGTTEAQDKNGNKKDQNEPGENTSNGLAKKKETPLLVAAKMGIHEMVKKIISACPVAIQDLDPNQKNVLMLAAENRQIEVLDYLIHTKPPEYIFNQVDDEGNSVLHLAAKMGEFQPWNIPGAALHLQWEIKWYKRVKELIPQLRFAHYNKNGETPKKIFAQTHRVLLKEGSDLLKKTSESCSVIAALVATVAFASAATVPGGLDDKTGHPILADHMAFNIFSMTSFSALCLSVAALIIFLTIIASRCHQRDFYLRLPRRLFVGLTCLFGSIVAMIVSFFAGHTFILSNKLQSTAVPIYSIASLAMMMLVIAYLPFHIDLAKATFQKWPLRSYKVFQQPTYEY